jgi:glutamate dehydrogenase (NAD(P)+)
VTGAPRTIVVRSAPGGDVLGFVCIDSLVNGRARGGLRLMPDVTPRELGLLARAMTLKYGFLGLPQGGAKAGVLGDPDAPPDERASILRRFAERAAAMLASRQYVPDSDMGTTGGEIQRMLEAVGIRVARREYRGGRSGLYTAATVFESACAAAAAQDLPLAGCRVAVEGFGRVGQPLAEMFVRAGARIVALSTRCGGLHNPRGLDLGAVRERVLANGDAAIAAAGLGDRIATRDLKSVPADILCPCARHESIVDADAASVEARVISCGANAPLTPGAERRLWERGVVCVPDFVANAGGVLGGTMEFAGWRTGEILHFCEGRYRPRVAALIHEARLTGTTLRDSTEAFARARFEEVKCQAELRSWRHLGVEAALAAYRQGWVPARLVRRLSAGYFRRCVG